jgi:hypothetical protein
MSVIAMAMIATTLSGIAVVLEIRRRCGNPQPEQRCVVMVIASITVSTLLFVRYAEWSLASSAETTEEVGLACGV